MLLVYWINIVINAHDANSTPSLQAPGEPQVTWFNTSSVTVLFNKLLSFLFLSAAFTSCLNLNVLTSEKNWCDGFYLKTHEAARVWIYEPESKAKFWFWDKSKTDTHTHTHTPLCFYFNPLYVSTKNTFTLLIKQTLHTSSCWTELHSQTVFIRNRLTKNKKFTFCVEASQLTSRHISPDLSENNFKEDEEFESTGGDFRRAPRSPTVEEEEVSWTANQKASSDLFNTLSCLWCHQ